MDPEKILLFQETIGAFMSVPLRFMSTRLEARPPLVLIEIRLMDEIFPYTQRMKLPPLNNNSNQSSPLCWQRGATSQIY
jgi:hypothetical protein